MDIAPMYAVADRRVRFTLKFVISIAALALADLVFFRVPIFNGFTRMWGDHLDGGIEATILEHWYNVVRGYSHWSQTNYFYPATRTIGYNDGYFLYGLIHSVFRLLGLDIIISSQLTDIVLKSTGFISFYLFVRTAFFTCFAYAVLGAAIFTIGHATFMHAFHQQLLSVCFAPLVAWLLILTYRALARLSASQAARERVSTNRLSKRKGITTV